MAQVRLGQGQQKCFGVSQGLRAGRYSLILIWFVVALRMFGMDVRCIVCYGCVSFRVKVVRLPPHLSSTCVCMCEKKKCLLMFLCWNILYRGAPMNGSQTVKTSVNTVNICWDFFFTRSEFFSQYSFQLSGQLSSITLQRQMLKGVLVRQLFLQNLVLT